MAPVKFEENIKDKLEKRTIQPSTEAWNALANRLDVQDKKKSTSRFWWMGIAASVVGILFVTSIYFNTKDVEISKPTIVDVNKVQKSNTTHINPEVTNETVVVQSENNPTTNNDKSVTSVVVKKVIPEQTITKKDIVVKELVAQNEKKAPVEKATELSHTKLSFEEAKVNSVVAEINKLKANNTVVTDSEIDALLKKAEKEIISNKLYNESTKTVDANALLQDVETDLQQSFRDRVFQALQSGYESVRTTVAERNN